MKKIFHLITSISLGGAESVAFELVTGCPDLSNKKLEFVLIEVFPTYTEYAGNIRKNLISKGVKCVTLFRGPKKIALVFAPFKLTCIIKRGKPDIIHSHTDIPDFVLSQSLKILSLFRLSTPFVVRTIHNISLWATRPILGRWVEKSFKDDIVIGVSNASIYGYRRLRKRSKLHESRHQSVIYNGGRLPESVETNDRNDHLIRPFHAAFIGRFEMQKGVDYLVHWIDAMDPQLRESFFFHFIGDGNLRSKVFDLKSHHSEVAVSDPIPDVYRVINQFDLIIMPSRFEGLALISIEASLAGVPVLAADAPGLNETLPPSWPLFFEIGNKEQFMKCLKEVNYGKWDLEELGEQSRSFVKSRFRLEKMLFSYNQIYDNLLYRN